MDKTTRTGREVPDPAHLVWHYALPIMLAVGLAFGIAAILVSQQSSTYTSTTRVLLSPSPANPLTAQSASGSGIQLTSAMQTEAQLVQSSAVSDRVSEEVGRVVPDDGERLSVSVPSNTQILEFKFTSTSPARAQEGAQGFAEGYLLYRSERSDSSQKQLVEALQEQIEETEARLRRATADAAEQGEGSYAVQEIQLFAARLAQQSNALSAAEALGTDPGTVITAAPLPASSNQLPGWVVYSGAGALGLMLGLGFAFMSEWRRDLITEDDSLRDLGVPVLSTISQDDQRPDVKELEPRALEAYRFLRTSIIANAPRPRVLGVSALGGAPSSDVATHLSMVLADAGFSVLLIVADPQNTSVARLLGLPIGEGSPAVGSAARIDLQGRVTETHGFAVLLPAWASDGSPGVASWPELRHGVDRLRRLYDYVLLLAPDAATAEGEAALTVTDSVLLVLAPQRTTRSSVSATLERFSLLGVRTVGVAVHASRPSDDTSPGADVAPPATNARKPATAERDRAVTHDSA